MQQRQLRSPTTARAHADLRLRALHRLALGALTALLSGVLLALLASPAAAVDQPAFTSAPSGTTTDTSLSWEGTLPTGTTAECSLVRNGVAEQFSDCTGGIGFALSRSGLTPADYLVQVRATSADGLETSATVDSPPVTVVAPADTTPPSVTVTGAPDTPGRDTTPTWALSLDDAVDADCSVAGAGTQTVDCSGGTATFTLSAPGTYAFSVTATDAAGNSTTAAGPSYELYPPAPAAPAVTVAADPDDRRVVTWSFSIAAGTTATCSLSGPGGSTPAAPGECDGSWVTTLATDGTWSAAVTLTDAYGGTGTGTQVVVLDTTAPDAPAAVTGPGARTNVASATWTFAEGEGTAYCALERDGVLGVSTVCSSPHTVVLPGDGRYRLLVALQDAAGNRSSATASSVVELDRVGPDAPSISNAPASPSNGGATRRFTWNHTTDFATECRIVSGATVVRDWTACSTGQVVLDVSVLPDGAYALELRSVDDLGNRGPVTVSAPVQLDVTAPAAPGLTAPAGPDNDGWTVAWTGEAGATASCVVSSGSTLVGTVSPCAPSTTFDLTGRPDGIYTVSVTLTDAAGNTSQPATASYEYDTTAPAAPVVSVPPNPSTTRDLVVTWTGDSSATATCVLRRGGTVSSTGTCTSGQVFAVPSDGTWTVEVTLTDAAGNTGPAGSAIYTLDTTPPSVPVFAAQPPTSADRRPTWEFGSDSGATLLCTVTDPSGAVLSDGVCSSPFTQNLAGRPDGRYVLAVRARDALGNTSAAGTSVFDLDTAAPAVPQVLTAPSTSGSRTPTWTLAAPDEATLRCRLLTPGGAVHDDGACGPTYSPDLGPTGADGTWTLEVRSVDTAGNASAPVTSTYVLDTTAPAVPVVVAAPATGSTTAPRWTMSTDAGTVLLCTLTGPDGDLAVTCGAEVVADLSGQRDGTFRLAVRARDAAGNLSAAVETTYLLDRVAPVAPDVTAPTGPSNVRSLPVTWTGEPGASATCTLSRAGSVLVTVPGCTSGQTFDLTGRPDGSYTVAVDLTDGAGNRGAAATAVYDLDTTAPAAPLVAAPAGPSNDRTWDVSWTGELGAVSRCTLTSSGTVLGLVDGCTSPRTVDLTGRPDGTYVLTVDLLDPAGNRSSGTSVSYTLDTTPPGPATFRALPPATSGRSPTWGLSGPAGTSLVCRLTGPSGAVLVSGACGATFTADLAGAADGPYLLEVRALDAAGNPSGPVTSTYVLDTAAPAAPEISAPTGPSNARSLPVSWTGEAGATATCVLSSGGTVLVVQEGCDSADAVDLTGRPDGSYTVAVDLTDAAGNRGVAGTVVYVLDTTAPAAPLVTAPAGPSNDLSWDVSWTGEAGSRARCTLSSGGTALEVVDGCTSVRTVDLTGRPDGTYVLTVDLLDPAGNRSGRTSVSYLLDTTPPGPATVVSAPRRSNDAKPSWQLSSPAGTSLVCRLVAPDGTVLLDGACATRLTVDLAATPDGAYLLEVRALDAAGNLSTPVSSTFELDRQEPAAPVFTREPPTSFVPEPRWEMTAEPRAVLSCRLVAPDGSVVLDAVCTSPLVVDLTGRPDGAYVLTVRAQDLAGNISLPAVSTFVLDTAAPSVPGFTAEPATSSTRAPRWETTTDPGTTLRCRLSGPGGLVVDATCGTVFTGDLTGRADGTYVLEVRAVDAAGNVSAPATSSYLLDTVAPDAPAFTTTPTTPSPVRTPSWSWTRPTGTTLECRLDGPLGVGTWTACGTTLTAALDGAPDGLQVLLVRARDAAGNLSSEVSSAYRLDTTPPEPVAVTPPSSPGSTRTPVWTFVGEPGASLQCRPADAGDWTVCEPGGRLTLDLSGAADGEHSVWVRAVDAAGNVGPATRSSYVLDTVAPSAPTVTSAPPTSFGRFPTWSFSSDAGIVVLCRVTAPGGAVVLDGLCGSPLTADLSGRPDGTYSLVLVARDAAGNLSAPRSSTFVLDTVAPASPDLTPPATPGSTTAPSWGVSTEATASCRLLGPLGQVLLDWALCGPLLTLDLLGQPDGAYTLEARATDAAGNVSAVRGSTYVLDTTAPPAPTVSAPASPSSTTTPLFTVSGAEVGAGLRCRLTRDGLLVTDWAPCSSGSRALPLSAGDGSYSLAVRHVDAAGNLGPISSATYVLDTTAPVPTVVTGPPATGNGRDPSWTFAAEPGAVLECRAGDSGAFGPCADGRTIVLDLSTAADGTHAVWVRGTDRAGNAGAAFRFAYLLDTRPPSAPLLTAPSGPSSERAPSWSWTGEASSTATCTLREGSRTISTGDCASAWTTALLSDGTYTLTVVLTDAAGNVSAPAVASYVLDTTPPAAPVVVGPSSPNLLQRPLFSITADDDTRGECRMSRGALALEDWRPCASPTSWTVDLPGTYVLEVRVYDLAGNVSPTSDFAYEYDPAATAGLLELFAPPSPSAGRTPTWRFRPGPGATTTCRLVGPGKDGRVLLSGPCDGVLAVTTPLATDGEYWLTITVSDGIGNVGVNELVYVLDTTGPAAPTVTPRGVESRDPVVGWEWSGDATTSSWRCRLLNEGVVVADWRACTPGRQDLTRLGEGRYVLQVVGLDALGNEGPVGEGSYRYDTTAPAALGLSTPTGGGGTTRVVPWGFVVPGDAATASCGVRLGGVLVRSLTSCTSGSYTMDLRDLPEGRYELVVLFTDAAGNVRDQVASYVLSASFVPRSPPPGPAGPAPRPAPEEPVVVGGVPRPRPVPPALVEPPAPVDLLLDRVRAGAVADGAGEAGSGTAREPADEEPDAGEPVLGLPGGPVSGARAVEALKDVAGETIRRPTLPIALLLLVGLFLLVQNRIDRRDPKLAGADVDEEPELVFRPVDRVVRRPARPGGAFA